MVGGVVGGVIGVIGVIGAIGVIGVIGHEFPTICGACKLGTVPLDWTTSPTQIMLSQSPSSREALGAHSPQSSACSCNPFNKPHILNVI